ncbi:GRAM domain-containing protein 4-like isoform X2 [Tubulanus polymorphus]|uniref:GRAM domain-containing protein 4-like isoform X2 n=1 Tax=Tubulanus polymorphus TaxID=672921 RepID=UPI003DA2B754
MSLRNAFKAKFRSLDRDFSRDERDAPHVTSKSLSLSEDDGHLPEDGISSSSHGDQFKDCMEEETTDSGDGCGDKPDGISSSKISISNISLSKNIHNNDSNSAAAAAGSGKHHEFKNRDEKAIYELQLTQLQEQLVAAMIENQNLASDLKAFREQNQVDKLMRQLDVERERNQKLVKELKQNRNKKVLDSPTKLFMSKQKLADSTDSWVDVADEAETFFLPTHDAGPKTVRTRFTEWCVSLFYEIWEDVIAEPEQEQQDDAEPDQLTVKKLKENLKRSHNASKPIINTYKGMQNLFSWKTPSLSIMVLLLYIYSLWHGWLLPVVLFLIIFRLFINYLKYIGWRVNIHYLTTEDEMGEKESDDKDLGVSDKFNLVLQVAIKAQNTLGLLADNLEKLKNLLTWQDPNATKKLFTFLCLAFISSCVLPGQLLVLIMGVYAGIKLFVIDYIYQRFPRIRQKHDTVYKMWQDLPTDHQLEKQMTHNVIDRSIIPPNADDIYELNDEFTGDVSRDDRIFLDLFSLPITEIPLPGWSGGRRCTLINREKPLTSAFKNGKLYLTRSFICFERSKSANPKNLVIPLTDIIKIDKAKPYSWMPGGGMALELKVNGLEKNLLFGALIQRDDVFKGIVYAGRTVTLPWAMETQA